MKICVVSAGMRLGRRVALTCLTAGMCAGPYERRDGRDDGFLLIAGELAVNRDREALGGGAFRLRERAAAVAEIREARLHVEWNGIVDLVADPLRVEVLLQTIPIGRSNDELVVDVNLVGRLGRQRDRAGEAGGLEQFAIPRGVGAASFGPRGEMRRLDAKARGLQRVHAAVAADVLAVVPRLMRVGAQQPAAVRRAR